MHKGPLVSSFAISTVLTVLLLGFLFSSSAFADAGGKGIGKRTLSDPRQSGAPTGAASGLPR